MPIVCEEFNEMLSSYTRTIPDNNILFKVTKTCGYSQLVVVPKYSINDTDDIVNADLRTLYYQIGVQMGDWAIDKVYFYTKREIYTDKLCIPGDKVYIEQIYTMSSVNQSWAVPLASVALQEFTTAYSVDECKYTVYQLYIDSPCECGIPHLFPHLLQHQSTNTSMNELDYVV